MTEKASNAAQSAKESVQEVLFLINYQYLVVHLNKFTPFKKLHI